MSIETILKENNKMLKELLGKVYGGSMLKKSKKRRDEISELPDMTAGMVPVFREKRNRNNYVKKIRIGKNFYQRGGNDENNAIIESFVEDVEQEAQEEVEDVEEEVEDVEPENTQNNGIKVGGKRPPRILRIMSIKTKKGKFSYHHPIFLCNFISVPVPHLPPGPHTQNPSRCNTKNLIDSLI